MPSRPSAPPCETEATVVYKRVSPSVVAVANNALVRRGLFFDFQIYEVPQGAGSGFVWDKKGHIVSNYHVVHQASTLTVTFPDGTQYDAKLVGIAPDYDLAVLKIDAPPDRLVPVAVAASRDLEVGQQVYAIGNPFGLDTTLSSGIVSALGRTITSMTDRKIHDVIQTDTAINPGNSGGPLLACRLAHRRQHRDPEPERRLRRDRFRGAVRHRFARGAATDRKGAGHAGGPRRATPARPRYRARGPGRRCRLRGV